VALCLLDYDRVERAEDELHHRMMCMASAYAMMDPRIPNSLAPLPLDNQRDIELGVLHYISYKTGGGQHIGKIPPGGLRGRILAENRQRQALRPIPQTQPQPAAKGAEGPE
jgi:hypothetical protein